MTTARWAEEDKVSKVDAIFTVAKRFKDAAQELGFGTGDESFIATKVGSRVGTVLVGLLAGVGLPGLSTSTSKVVAGLLATAAAETVTDFVARTLVSPKYKVVAAAVAAKRGELDALLARVTDFRTRAKDEGIL
jgi:hypothetical protein